MTTSLYELFPSLDRGVVADVLHQCSNNVDQAVDILLGMSLDSATLAEAPVTKHQTPRTKTFAAKKQPGWSAVTAEERGIVRPVSHYAPAARRAAELSDSLAFPALSPEQLQAPRHSAAQAAERSLWRSSNESHARDHGGPTGGNSHARKLDVSQSARTAVTPRESLSQTEDGHGAPHGKGEGAHGADTIQSLRVLHPWADTALLQDVLQAAEGDVNAAAWMLSELHNPVTPGMSPQMSPSMSPWASPLGSPLGSPHISPARSHLPPPLSSPRPPDLATIAELAGQKARPASNPKPRAYASREPAKPAHTSNRGGKVGRSGAPGTRAEHKDSLSSESVRQRRERSEDEGDAYYSFRGEALQLTRRWQRAAHKATSAFSGGSHSEARKFAREARHLREKALKAHAQAAASIEEANNVGKGHDSWTLDLHGLHGTEAVEAVDRRVVLLSRLLASEGKRAGSLRVITGKGNHSSGGEGSLGRVIDNHLVGQSMAHTVQGGAIVVHIRAQDQGPRRH